MVSKNLEEEEVCNISTYHTFLGLGQIHRLNDAYVIAIMIL